MSEAAGGEFAAGRWSVVGAIAVVLVAAAAIAPTLDRVDRRGPDEAHYVAYTGSLLAEGPAAFRPFFRGYVDDPKRWVYPNPLRMAFLSASAIWAAIFGASFESLSSLSLVCHLLSIGACYAFARRFLGEPRGLFVAALVAFSPLWMGLARRALMDSFATLTSLLAIWTFFEAVRQPARAGLRWLFGAAFALSILGKETAVLLALPFALWLVVEVRIRRSQLPWRAFALALAAPPLVCAGTWLLAAGDSETLLRLVEIIVTSPAGNEYALAFGRGPWYRYLVDFLLLSPWTTVLALGAIGGFALRALGTRQDGADPILAYLALLVAAQLFAYAFFTKNVRYVAVLELPLRVFAVCALWELMPARRTRVAVAACALVVALLCWSDHRSFRGIFVEGGVYDPVSAPLLSYRGLVTGP